jgi:hypothetical protein
MNTLHQPRRRLTVLKIVVVFFRAYAPRLTGKTESTLYAVDALLLVFFCPLTEARLGSEWTENGPARSRTRCHVRVVVASSPAPPPTVSGLTPHDIDVGCDPSMGAVATSIRKATRIAFRIPSLALPSALPGETDIPAVVAGRLGVSLLPLH